MKGTDAEGRQPFDFLAVSAVATAARSALKRGGVQGRCPDAAPVRRASIHASFSRPACGAGGGGARIQAVLSAGAVLPSLEVLLFVCAISPPAEILQSTQPVLDLQPTPPPGCCNAAVAHSGTRQQAREATRFCSKQDDPAVVGSGRKACACWKRLQSKRRGQKSYPRRDFSRCAGPEGGKPPHYLCTSTAPPHTSWCTVK